MMTMTTLMTNYIELIERLPAGGTLTLPDVSWEEYEQLLADLGDSNRFRLSYGNGRLKVMRPSSNHEMFKELILRIACAIAEETNVAIETRGSTTFRQEQFEHGAEPDTCFYIENASRIIGKKRIDLDTDPPPDVIVEIDVSHDSTGKLDFYAALGVPEIWRYDEQRARIYHLIEGSYSEQPRSLALETITADALTGFLEQSKTEGQSAALRSFREWLKQTL
jgi:Uma2 family endonuclease